MLKRVYFDHNAGSPLREVARERLLQVLGGHLANASSSHAEGRAARDTLEEAREELAELAGCQRDELFFTSGGTESNALALQLAPAGHGVAASATEHPSLRAAVAEREDGVLLAVDSRGELATRDSWPRVALSSCAFANHETGVLQDLERVVVLARAAGSLVHSDLCQAFGRVPLELARWDLDAASLSAHKLGGPAGVGALILRRDAQPTPLWKGGAQEAGRRPGTESVALAASFAAAAAEACAELEEQRSRMVKTTLDLRSSILGVAPDARVFSDPERGLPNTLTVAFPGHSGAALVMRLDLEGVAASYGSACASGSHEPSPVLLAMGCDEALARAAVRFSVGHNTEPGDVRVCAERLCRALDESANTRARKNAPRTHDG
ncbi:MAG: cysteine desulfurase NifS [Planctomycetota bacterium]|nr:MAG: cysteine desulfurase NifS [Planctomycetota bacterium]